MIVVAAACAGLLVAACGGSSPTGRQAAARSDYADAVKVSQCMRTHGVPDFPDPSANGGTKIQASQSSSGQSSINVDGHALNESAPAFQHAMNQCQKYAPQGPPISAAQLAKVRVGALAMAKCMRAHGVTNFPDPDVSTGPNGHGISITLGAKAAGSGADLNPNSPAFQAAQKICQPLMKSALSLGKP
jgi:hypothetical protein